MNEGEEFKEVCAYFGAAMYCAQVLEHGIANSLVYLDLIPKTNGKWTPEEYDQYFENNFEKTLGNLIKTLKKVASVPELLESQLYEAKKRRAFLAHHFFRERIDSIYQSDLQSIIRELDEYADFFRETDNELQAFVKPIMRRYGFSDEWLQNALTEYKKQLANTP